VHTANRFRRDIAVGTVPNPVRRGGQLRCNGTAPLSPFSMQPASAFFDNLFDARQYGEVA
jgi:hypothetical protein